MFSFIRQVLIVSLSFSSSFGLVVKVFNQTKCPSLNDEPCIIRPTLIDLDPAELKYYPHMNTLDDCNGSCNVIYPKMCSEKIKRYRYWSI